MKFKLFIGLCLCAALLAGCTGHAYKGDEMNDFKPYLLNEQQVLPNAYPKTAWAYPAGTSTRAIIARWRQAGLVIGAYNHKGILDVMAGPQFYNLSFSDQRGLGDAIAQMYGVNHYLLFDSLTGKGVGSYTPQGLQMY